MRKLWVLVKREYLERVRTKAFVIGTVLGPLLMGGLTVIPGLMMSRGGKPLHIAVVDIGGHLAAAQWHRWVGYGLIGAAALVIAPLLVPPPLTISTAMPISASHPAESLPAARSRFRSPAGT